jgi:hypothetical protein
MKKNFNYIFNNLVWFAPGKPVLFSPLLLNRPVANNFRRSFSSSSSNLSAPLDSNNIRFKANANKFLLLFNRNNLLKHFTLNQFFFGLFMIFVTIFFRCSGICPVIFGVLGVDAQE